MRARDRPVARFCSRVRVESFNMITPRAGLPSLLVAFSLAACGVDPLLEMLPVPGSLTLATPDQRVQGAVVEGRYVVAFRAPSGAAGLRFPSFFTENRYHYGYLAESFLPDPKVKELRYITTIDLANPHDPSE